MNRRTFLRSTVAAGALAPALLRSASTPASSIAPKCLRAVATKFELSAPIKSYVAAVTDHWLKVAPYSNPAMLEMFRDRDRLPLRHMEPWAGEFAGKHLTAAVQVYRVSGDPQLRKFIEWFVPQLIAGQAEDGYLGPWAKQNRLTGFAPNIGKNGGGTWDAWGHYHIMLGLLLWHEETGDRAALTSATRIGGTTSRPIGRNRPIKINCLGYDAKQATTIAANRTDVCASATTRIVGIPKIAIDSV